ncbi:MAG: hypothetical protein QGI63_12645 [Rhodospirillales bacterium]|nr:hypothetical protein [Rhodospirillales bacterium]
MTPEAAIDGNVTGRDGFLIAEALYLAIEYIDQLPRERRPLTDQADMMRLLTEMYPGWFEVVEAAKRRRP